MALAGCFDGRTDPSPPSGSEGTNATTGDAAGDACLPASTIQETLAHGLSGDDQAGAASRGVHAPETVSSAARLAFGIVLGPAPAGAPQRVLQEGPNGLVAGSSASGKAIEYHSRWHEMDMPAERATNPRLNVTFNDPLEPGEYRLTICLERRAPPPAQESLGVEYFNRTVRVGA